MLNVSGFKANYVKSVEARPKVYMTKCSQRIHQSLHYSICATLHSHLSNSWGFVPLYCTTGILTLQWHWPIKKP